MLENIFAYSQMPLSGTYACVHTRCMASNILNTQVCLRQPVCRMTDEDILWLTTQTVADIDSSVICKTN